MNLTTLSGEAGFEADVLDAPGAVLVDFFASWCGPCKSLAPILEDVAGELAGSLRIVKIDADENGELARRYNVRGLPTMILFVGGVERARQLGAVSKTRLMALIEDHLEAT